MPGDVPLRRTHSAAFQEAVGDAGRTEPEPPSERASRFSSGSVDREEHGRPAPPEDFSQDLSSASLQYPDRPRKRIKGQDSETLGGDATSPRDDIVMGDAEPRSGSITSDLGSPVISPGRSSPGLYRSTARAPMGAPEGRGASGAASGSSPAIPSRDFARSQRAAESGGRVSPQSGGTRPVRGERAGGMGRGLEGGVGGRLRHRGRVGGVQGRERGRGRVFEGPGLQARSHGVVPEAGSRALAGDTETRGEGRLGRHGPDATTRVRSSNRASSAPAQAGHNARDFSASRRFSDDRGFGPPGLQARSPGVVPDAGSRHLAVGTEARGHGGLGGRGPGATARVRSGSRVLGTAARTGYKARGFGEAARIGGDVRGVGPAARMPYGRHGRVGGRRFGRAPGVARDRAIEPAPWWRIADGDGAARYNRESRPPGPRRAGTRAGSMDAHRRPRNALNRGRPNEMASMGTAADGRATVMVGAQRASASRSLNGEDIRGDRRRARTPPDRSAPVGGRDGGKKAKRVDRVEGKKQQQEDEDADERECRVCRGGDEGGKRPLAHPCACRGSIKYVHQDCLMEWLRSRRQGMQGGGGGGEDAIALQSQRCELCREPLVFRAKYHPDAPAQLGPSQFIRGALRRAAPPFMNAFRCMLNILLWGAVVPIMFCVMFRLGLGMGLLLAQELSALFSGGGIVAYPDALSKAAAKAAAHAAATANDTVLPGVRRLLWSNGVDLLSDWCCGLSLMIGVMCLGPPIVELTMEFVVILKTMPVAVERWWTNFPEADRALEGRQRTLRHAPANGNGPGNRPARARLGARRGGLLGLLDRIEMMLVGVLEQLAAPPRDEEADGEGQGQLLWGWPAITTALGCLAFMGILVMSAQTVPYVVFNTMKAVSYPGSWVMSPRVYRPSKRPVPVLVRRWDSVHRTSAASTSASLLRFPPLAADEVGFDLGKENAPYLGPFSPSGAWNRGGMFEKAIRGAVTSESALVLHVSMIGNPAVDALRGLGGESKEAARSLVRKREDGQRVTARGVGGGRGRWSELEAHLTARNRAFLVGRRLEASRRESRAAEGKADRKASTTSWGNASLASSTPSPSSTKKVKNKTKSPGVSSDQAKAKSNTTAKADANGTTTSATTADPEGIGGFWRAVISFSKGPAIPGTTDLRSGEVLCETVQGHVILCLSLLALCFVYSVVRLRIVPPNPAMEENAAGLPAANADAAGVDAEGDEAVNGLDGHEREGPEPNDDAMVEPGGPALMERDVQVGVDLKVTTMGMLELILLPLWVGITADVFALPMFASSVEARLAWAADNPLSSIALHWGAGSMAVGIVGCLGREIRRALKPNMLPPWAQRPPEHGLEEVLARMTNEPLLSQLRLFMVSMVTYPLVLSLMIMVPAYSSEAIPSLMPEWVRQTFVWSLIPKIRPMVLGIGEPTQGDRLGMDLVLFHFILPVVMEHLKIRGPVRRVAFWVLRSACSITGTRLQLLHPAILAGRGMGANDPDDLDDIALPNPPNNGDGDGEDDDDEDDDEDDGNGDGDENRDGDGDGEGDALAGVGRGWDQENGDGGGVIPWRRIFGRRRHERIDELIRLVLAAEIVCTALGVLPVVTILVPLLSGRALFKSLSLPLDDDLPPLVAGAILCSGWVWVLTSLWKARVAAGEYRSILWKVAVLAGKWTVLSLLLLGAIPGLTGLLVHDALRGPLPPAEETAALTWGKIWALGLVCVKVWARCVMAGVLGGNEWHDRLRRLRANGFLRVDFWFTLTQVCFPLLDKVGQYYFWPYLVNRFALPLVIISQRDLRLLQKGTPFVFLLGRGVWLATLFSARKVKALHDRIRDDEYLVGLELQNMPGHDSS